MSRVHEIAQRWTFPGHHFADVTPEQVEDVRYLLGIAKAAELLDDVAYDTRACVCMEPEDEQKLRAARHAYRKALKGGAQ